MPPVRAVTATLRSASVRPDKVNVGLCGSTVAVDTATRNTFVPVTVKIGAFAGAVRAAVDFGYGEYGNPSSFYCTPRAEACTALGATINIAAPFVYAGEGAGGVSCRTGCTITIPALAARVLYYRIRYSDAAGNPVVTGPVQVLASPEAAGAHN